MLNWANVDEVAGEAMLGAMERGARSITARAKELAPVRKVFTGQDRRYRVRMKSIEEIESDRDLRVKLGLGPERTHLLPPDIVTQRAPQMLGRNREIASPGQLRIASAQARLDRRGRYELRSMRAAHEGYLGGGLRDRIYTIGARFEGKRIVAGVVSPAPYSKYQEMGTSHNPAHPYMRPAGHQGQEPLKADIRRSVIAAVQPRMSGRIEIVIKSVSV